MTYLTAFRTVEYPIGAQPTGTGRPAPRRPALGAALVAPAHWLRARLAALRPPRPAASGDDILQAQARREAARAAANRLLR